MEIQRLRLGMYQSNCYIIKEDNKAFIVDPGDNGRDIVDYLNNNKLELQFILLTHGHVDHVNGVDAIIDEISVPVYIHIEDKKAIESKTPIFGHVKAKLESIKEGDILEFNNHKIKVLETPGHTLGGLCFVIEDEKIIFTGDTLFKHSIGRSDLFGGNGDALIRGIKEKLIPLGDDYVVYPGHDMETTIGHEIKYNMFLK